MHQTGWNRPVDVAKLSEDQEIWFISDLHLGDGTPSDVFFGKDRHLLALIQTVSRRGGTLVVGGDAMDFHQAWSFTRILKAHKDVLGAMSDLARDGRLIYIVGNHDYDISLYRELLNFRVCDELHVGKTIKVTHGYEYDPFHANKDLAKGQVGTKVHHLIERYLDTWIRIPLGEFYTFPNRLLFWIAHKVAVVAHGWATVMSALGYPRSLEKLDQELNFWARSNMGDPMCMFPAIARDLESGSWPYIVCGHSHLPGIIRQHGRAYINTGSWTFASSHYAVWDGSDFRSSDWITGRNFSDEMYRPLLNGSIDEKDFWAWWRENYMGFLRFREGEERLGRLRGWESYVRDHQAMGNVPTRQLSSLPTPEPGTAAAEPERASSEAPRE